MRTLKIVFFSVSFFLCSNFAYSLGVGDLQVNSSLNEQLSAEIALVSLRPGEIDNIRVAMASPAEYARAGIDRPLVLSFLKFRVEERPGNKAAIIVYSKKPIKEPFLDFLVEIDWADGRMLREYTMLLDPPVLSQRKAERVQAPVTAAPAVAEPEPRPVLNKPAPRVSAAPVERSEPASAPAAGADNELFPRIDISGGAPAPADNAASFKPALDVSSDGYKTKPKDTLWSISDRLRPESISIEQMMLALQNANPAAFEDNNINGLKAGYVLRIPDQSALLAFSKSEAFRAAQDQNKAWNSARGGLINRVTTKGTAPVSATKTPAPQATPAEAGVKLVTPKSGVASKGAGTGKDLDALRQELALVNEQLVSKDQQNTDLQGRVRELEEQIASMERLIELKSKSLEDLQSKIAEPVVNAPASEPMQAEPKPLEPVQTQTGPVEVPKTINPYVLNDAPKAEEPPVEIVKPEPAPKPVVKPAPVVTPAAPAEKSIVDTILGILDDVTVLAMVGVALIGILALVWVVMRRRSMNNMSFPESILTDKGSSTVTQDTRSFDETSLLSDFAPTSMGASTIETEVGEVDPLSEADVYLAYNKYQQAEELLKNAIISGPERIDLKVKLLEVYFNAKNSNAFADLAEDIHSAVGDQDAALWDKVVSMGSELCPTNPLFATDDEGLNIGEIAENDTLPVDETDDIEFDLGDLEIDEEPEAAPVADLAAPVEETTVEKATDESSLDIGDLELDMDFGAAEEPAVTEPAAQADSELDELSLEEMDEVEDTSSDSAVDFGELDLESLDETTAGAETASAGAADEEGSFSIDEVATKLDLAKAYIDMGDPDGARSILDEVLAEGDEGQKSEAKDLIQQL